jgi:hypothetical protein
MTSRRWFGIGITGLAAVLAMAFLMAPSPAGVAQGEFALKCQGTMDGAGALKCHFWIDGIKVTQQPTGGTIKKVDPGKHQVEAQAWYKTGADRDAKWVKAPTGKKSREVKVQASETKDVAFDFGTVRP